MPPCSSPAGGTAKHRRADAQGGVVFRGVKPGAGYRVRGRGRAVGAAHGALQPLRAAEHGPLRPEHPVQRLRLSDHPRRHSAGDRRAPAAGRRERGSAAAPGPAAGARGADAHPDRVLGLRLRRPRRPAERDRDPREPDGLHRRRREHARNGLLGRRVRLLRAAPEPRRLRRRRDDRAPAVGGAQQGRDDGHLLRRHQPAVHRRHAAAEPGGDLAAVGPRRDADDPLSGRRAEHRLRRQLGEGAHPGGQAGVGDGGPGVGLQAHPGG